MTKSWGTRIPMPMRRFKLPDLMDYELKISQDQESSMEELQERDRQIAASISFDEKTDQRSRLLIQWLDKIRSREKQDWPGPIYTHLYKYILVVSAIVACVLGSSSTRLLLSYNGTTPINVIPILGFFVIFQTAMLTIGLGFRSITRLRGASAQSSIHQGAYPGLVGAVMLYLERVVKRKIRRSPSWRTLDQSLSRVHQLYCNIEAMLSLQALLFFSLLFNISALVTMICTGVFYDLAFSWSTSLHMASGEFHQFIQVLGSPFAWLIPEAVPSESTVLASQFIRLEDRYSYQGSIPNLDRQTYHQTWWLFLCVSVCFYSVLPRFVLLIVLRLRMSRELSKLSFDDYASETLFKRLKGFHQGWSNDDQRPISLQDKNTETFSPQTTMVFNEKDYYLVFWRDVPSDEVDLKSSLAQPSLNIVKSYHANGTATDLDIISHDLKSLVTSHRTALLILCDSWELPGEAIQKLINRLRDEGLESLPILFYPIQWSKEDPSGEEPEERRLWKTSIADLKDPYVGLFSLGE
ncbi:DUF2868 domain-containing protein [Pseudobacteriovorax antillogorgiicola]|uniref:DUF2868 domain-containing protein n=1 Tax=Pseudobacteriovorax antillogorgiicola TaxID=1513793 RepID=A0A1Y6CIT3_9BACT|nr:DUF2868 domain-containing protein [Pseudobacteriovorax antillogorgiicola]TCS46974.1 uncharacterized protein DUF2868 [Pseudobacteriovorax antillogorgiicola]SMF64686.1 Protein of unknown function [Pseudobacteriovorax antillogorgiicola]